MYPQKRTIIIPIQKIPKDLFPPYELINERDRYLGTNTPIPNGLYLIQNDSDGWN